MYPHSELSRLAAHKDEVRRKIELRRAQCARAVESMVKPVTWVEKVLNYWANLPPLLRVTARPIAALVARTVLPTRMKPLRRVFRWAPIAIDLIGGALRGSKALRRQSVLATR